MPFYQFNSFTGRIVESTHPQPYYPLSPVRLDRAEPPKIMNNFLKPVEVAPATSSPSARYSTLPPKLIKKMEQFQRNDGVPVFIKGGLPDKILLGITLTAIGIGLAGCAKVYYDLSFPKKK